MAGVGIRRQRHRIAVRRGAAHRGIDAKRRGVTANHQLRYAVGDQQRAKRSAQERVRRGFIHPMVAWRHLQRREHLPGGAAVRQLVVRRMVLNDDNRHARPAGALAQLINARNGARGIRRRRRKQSFLHIDNQQRGGHGGSRRLSRVSTPAGAGGKYDRRPAHATGSPDRARRSAWRAPAGARR